MTNSRQSLRNIASGICAAALFCVGAGASAQTVYKEVDDEGRTLFSDQPAVKKIAGPRRGTGLEASEAARRLKQAQLERAMGADPRPGELTRGAGARTVNYRYWQRQEGLRREVEQAMRRSNETRSPQLASR